MCLDIHYLVPLTKKMFVVLVKKNLDILARIIANILARILIYFKNFKILARFAK